MDEDGALLQRQCSETGTGYLTLPVGSINVWNRVRIGLRAIHQVEEPAAIAA